MSRHLSTLAPLVSFALVGSILAGCGATPERPSLPVTAATVKNVKVEAQARKETRLQAERRAKGYIAEFNDRQWRSINARTEMVEKIARTDADVAYDFLLQEIDDLQELRGDMKTVTLPEAEAYEEMLTEQLDEMTPDQQEVKKRVTKAESLKIDLDELTITEERAIGSIEAIEAKWGSGGARVGSRNRVLSAIQESKLYKAAKKAYKNTRKKVKKALSNLWKKLRWN
ncbi:MAG: hypothetical protein ACK46X_08070 [Candidatus Sericytochromatia bacterium]